jgi:shikimate kinase
MVIWSSRHLAVWSRNHQLPANARDLEIPLNQTVIIIGPGNISPVGQLLAERLSLPFCELHRVTDGVLEAVGLDREAEHRAWSLGSFAGWYRYRAAFEVAAIERVLPEHHGEVVVIGGMQVVQEDSALRARLAAALAGAIVVLLLPDADRDRSVAILEAERKAGEITIDGQDFSEYFTRHPSNYRLAKQTVYTRGKTPEETCEDVVQVLDPSSETVILIGPINTGKSTIADLLSERLSRKRAELDMVRWDYYREIGFSKEEQDRIYKSEGMPGILRYWKPFEIHSVERILADHPDSVIDFGAGHSVYDDPDQMARAIAALAPLPNVILLMPDPDPDVSIAILRERLTPRIDGLMVIEFSLNNPSFAELATTTIYTEGKTPEEAVAEIVGVVSSQ